MEEIPMDFLREAPSNATLHQLDFTTTTPPIPAFKDHFAAIVDNFMTEDECNQLLHLASPSENEWERALLNAGNGKQVYSVENRNCGRIIWDSADLAQRLLDRLRPFIQECGIDTIENQPLVTGRGPVKRGEVFCLSQLNERIRFLRYEGGEYFRPHWDGSYVMPEGDRSLYTIHLYLNGSGEQDIEELEREIERVERREELYEEDGEIDLAQVGENVSATEEREESTSEDLLGGATSFTDGYDAKDAVRVFPKAGSVLIFQQRNLFHGGDDVFRGVKYTIRTDIMYKAVC